MGIIFYLIIFHVYLDLKVSGMLLVKDNTNFQLEQCIVRSVGKFFPNDATIYVVEGSEAYFTNYSTIPHVTLNLNNPIHNFTEYGTNFIIPTKDGKSLLGQLTTMVKSSVWRSYESTMGKFVIVTSSTYVEEVFKVLWMFNIVNAIIISEDGCSVYSSNPYSQKNHCGSKVEEYITQNCFLDLSFTFLKPLRNLNQCPIIINMTEMPTIITMVLDKFTPYLQQALNVEINKTTTAQISNVKKDDNNVILNIFTFVDVKSGDLRFTDEMFRSHFVWVSPMAKEVFTLQAIGNIFQYDVWILFILTIIAVSIAWGLILKFTQFPFKHDSFGKGFINIISLTICGCIRKIPQLAKLRSIILLYLFYVIIIQTAFKANLIKMLTSVIDSNEIKSVQDVANSKLTLCVPIGFKRTIFGQNKPHDEIYTKIKNKLVEVEINPVDNFNTTHCIQFMINVEFILFLSNMGKSTVVVDEKFGYNPRLHFSSLKPHYLMSSVNAAIERWKESGVYEHHVKQIMDQIRNVSEETDEPIPLTLEHLSGVFAIFAFGLLLSLIVFMLELVIYKIYN
ncbi:hypothetical protein RI129_002224 [Pyrocoelia pectoralis]|uniref:Ionotropic glutamate receptor C-terminal domain-containing protein n=1 Tax=Pyrocoelia pectoralis TaxID=417401 RepID=A0AAN7ZLW9_9COLE